MAAGRTHCKKKIKTGTNAKLIIAKWKANILGKVQRDEAMSYSVCSQAMVENNAVSVIMEKFRRLVCLAVYEI